MNDKYNKGSFTVEAALSLPVFLLACVVILYFFIAMRDQMETRVGVFESARILATAAYAEDSGSGKYITLSAPAYTDIPVRFFGRRKIIALENVRLRKWTGYDPTETSSDDEEMVYITETGTVYHRDRECSYLNPSIKTVAYEALSYLRNSSGHIYYACRSCVVSKTGAGSVYITTYGESYHRDINCEGLKRTIYCVPISEVGGRGPCSKCGG